LIGDGDGRRDDACLAALKVIRRRFLFATILRVCIGSLPAALQVIDPTGFFARCHKTPFNQEI